MAIGHIAALEPCVRFLHDEGPEYDQLVEALGAISGVHEVIQLGYEDDPADSSRRLRWAVVTFHHFVGSVDEVMALLQERAVLSRPSP